MKEHERQPTLKDTNITVMFDNPKTNYTNMKDTNTITVMFDNPKTNYTNMKDTNTVTVMFTILKLITRT